MRIAVLVIKISTILHTSLMDFY